MVVSTEKNTISAVGNAITTVFPYDFLIYILEHVEVSLDGVLQVSGFSVDGLGNNNGGNVTFDVPPAQDVVVFIRRVVPNTQEIDYTAFDPFPAETHERGLDLGVMRDQQQETDNQQTLRVPTTDPQVGLVPAVDLRKDRVLAFDENGDPVPGALSSGSGVLILDDLLDVTITTPVAGEVLEHDGVDRFRNVKPVAHTDPVFNSATLAAITGILESNVNFIDAVIFGPALDPGPDWSGKTVAPTARTMLATITDIGADTNVKIWDFTSGTLVGATPLATVTLVGKGFPFSCDAAGGYIIVGGRGDGISIIDPFDGSWAERTEGWPKSLTTATTPALNDNDIGGVSAGYALQATHDPRSGGPMPMFQINYKGGSDYSAVMYDDGFFLSAGGGSVNIDGNAIANGRVYFADTLNTLIQSIDNNLQNFNSGTFVLKDLTFPFGLMPDKALSIEGNKMASASDDGLTLSEINVADVAQTAHSIIKRDYNTGMYVGELAALYLSGSVLASARTGDRSYRNLTLTQTGTLQETAVEPGADLFGVNGWSTGNFLERANNAAFEQADNQFHFGCWMKPTNETQTRTIIMKSTTADQFGYRLRMTSSGQLEFINNDATDDAVNTVAVYDTNEEWIKVDCLKNADDVMQIYVNGQLDVFAVITSTKNTNSVTATFRIGLSGAGANAAGNTEISNVHVTKVAPTPAQIRQMYEAERGMYVANAKCLLQSPTTNAVLDASVDPVTGKVLVTQVNSQAIWDGLAIESERTVAAGGTSFAHGKMHGNRIVEINDANLYAEMGAEDLREVAALVEGLSAGVPVGADLSKAKAWITYIPSVGTIIAAFNIKSLTIPGAGLHDIELAIPLKFASSFGDRPGPVSVTCHESSAVVGTVNTNGSSTSNIRVETRTLAGALTNPSAVSVILFGELENE